MIPAAVAPQNRTAAAPPRSRENSSPAQQLLARFHEVRNFSARLTENLAPEDCVVQSIPDVSPTKWHLAHTTWFFETFILKKWKTGYRDGVPEYAYLFNSYYNAAGAMHRRDLRGLISRPTVEQTKKYRSSVNADIDDLVSNADEELFREIEPILILGIHHEQQHQELLITDIKHVFAQNPLYPVFKIGRDVSPKRPSNSSDGSDSHPTQFVAFDEATVEIGHDGNGFSYDNEGPRHRALVLPFALANRLVTNAEYLEFMRDNGYSRSEFWLSLGWMTVNEQKWSAPLYWIEEDGAWSNFTLSGLREVDPDEPVTHLSYFEADAFAKWAGARLPTEFEWERAAAKIDIDGNFVETERFHPAPVNQTPRDETLAQMFGDVWEWTRSSYSPYPGYRAEPGALGEYNGKFMCNQYVLRGGSCATSRTHIRKTYRNFFQPEKRWQFTGIRLARDVS
ncbi:MAG TPA: ergothioneine biosynthesis protein EgtB [Chthoniobacterales bacterium]|nr:ergothioneine biosynthesis protein EgtB [Chthoniobacterales bacterium]